MKLDDCCGIACWLLSARTIILAVAVVGAGGPAWTAAACSGCGEQLAAVPEVKSEKSIEPSRPLTDEEKKWGIEALGPRLSAGGFMLDFRCRVLDPEKAKPLLDAKAARQLIHEKTGATLKVTSSPKVGAMRQTTSNATKGGVYFSIFANPGRTVKAGDKVTVVLGECRLERVVQE